MPLSRVILFVALIAGSARADDDNNSRARAHFEIGNGMYRLGDYQGALREFAAGYELTKKPGFLINLGQTYRKLHDLGRAREMYQQYLAVTPPDDPSRVQAQQVLSDIEVELRSQPQQPPPEPVPPPPTTVTPSTPPAPLTSTTVSAAPPPKKKKNKALIASGIVLGVVGLALVGGGAGAALLADGLAQDLNNLDARRGTFDPAKDDQYKLDRSLEGGLLGAGVVLAVTGVILVAVGAR
jgi:tetratricopeptide (TPR) repeat protein